MVFAQRYCHIIATPFSLGSVSHEQSLSSKICYYFFLCSIAVILLLQPSIKNNKNKKNKKRPSSVVKSIYTVTICTVADLDFVGSGLPVFCTENCQQKR